MSTGSDQGKWVGKMAFRRMTKSFCRTIRTGIGGHVVAFNNVQKQPANVSSIPRAVLFGIHIVW